MLVISFLLASCDTIEDAIISGVMNIAYARAEEINERLLVAFEKTQSHIEYLEHITLTTTQTIADSQRFVGYLNNWNSDLSRYTRLDILHYLSNEKEHMLIDFFTVTDSNGIIVLRTQSPDMYGDSVITPHILAGLEGVASVSFSSTPLNPLGIISTSPIWHDGEIIGALTAFVDIATNDFIDDLSLMLGAEIVVFSGDVSVASTIRADDGQRIVGTFADPFIMDIVMGELDIYYSEPQLLQIGGQLYGSVHLPLHNWTNNQIGFILVCVPIRR